MKFTILEPEVAGGLGARTIVDTSRHPPVVSHLHYEFGGWLGDDLLDSFPCFVASERLAAELIRSKLTGFTLDDVETSVSTEFTELQPHTHLPVFRWLKVVGQSGVDDLGLDGDHKLVVSATVLELLDKFSLIHADRSPYIGRTV